MSRKRKPGEPRSYKGRIEVDADELIEALREERTVIGAARRMGISRITVHRRMKEDPELRRRVNEEKRAAVAAVEKRALLLAAEGYLEPLTHNGKVIGSVRKYVPQLITFILKTRMPKRYSERRQIMEAMRSEAGEDTAKGMLAASEAIGALMPPDEEFDENGLVE